MIIECTDELYRLVEIAAVIDNDNVHFEFLSQ